MHALQSRGQVFFKFFATSYPLFKRPIVNPSRLRRANATGDNSCRERDKRTGRVFFFFKCMPMKECSGTHVAGHEAEGDAFRVSM